MGKTDIEEIPAIIGTRMASNNKLNMGDLVTLRWRDTYGTFDAAKVKIVGIFKTNVPAIDNTQIWIPLLWLQSIKGFALPQGMDDYGLAVTERLSPVYSVGLILGTIILVFISATIVSYLPARKIAKMKPTDAIKGKIQ